MDGQKPQVSVYEVGLRDGLQNEAEFVPTEKKAELLQALVQAGMKRIELTSFVSPKWIPQLADHQTLATQLNVPSDVSVSALVPNLRGLENALNTPLKEVAVFLSASEAHSKKNINKSIAQALDAAATVAARARTEGLRVRAYVSTVFGCPYEGHVDVDQVVELTRSLLSMDAYEISLGDTIGVAHPAQVRTTLEALRAADIPFAQLALHMHDTRGTALANVLAGLDAGIRTFDAALGGLGGCPYAPGASGNLATEDLVYMLEGMGFETGIDLGAVCDASILAEQVLGRALPSKVLRAEVATRKKRAQAQS